MKKYRAGIDIGSTTVKLVVLDDADEILYGEYRRHQAHTQETLSTLLEEAKKSVGECELRFALPAPVRSIWGKRWIFPLSRRSLPSLQP